MPDWSPRNSSVTLKDCQQNWESIKSYLKGINTRVTTVEGKVWIPTVSSVPTTNLVDGQEIYYLADGTNGVVWTLKYRAAEPTYKWNFVGGPPLFTKDDTDRTTTSTTYVALTGGLTLALPLAGDYDCRIETTADIPVANSAVVLSYTIGGSSAGADVWGADTYGNTGMHTSMGVTHRHTGLAVQTLSVQGRISFNAGTATFKRQRFSAIPVRVI